MSEKLNPNQQFPINEKPLENITISTISDILYNLEKRHLDKRFPYFVALVQSMEFLKANMTKEEFIRLILEQIE